MKKTIFCAFTMGFAIAAQAVAVQWNTGFLYTPDLSQEGVTYTKTYIVGYAKPKIQKPSPVAGQRGDAGGSIKRR